MERGRSSNFFLVVAIILARLKISNERQVQPVAELREALDNVKVLKGIIPICAWCKKIRDDTGFWQEVEVYLSKNSEAIFTHGICPVCRDKFKAELKGLNPSRSCPNKPQKSNEQIGICLPEKAAVS